MQNIDADNPETRHSYAVSSRKAATEEGATQMTMQEFVKTNCIRMTAYRTDTNPNMADDGHPMDHWKCHLTAHTLGREDRRSLTVYFSMGTGHNGKEPKTCEVLNCLASDASGIENARDFTDWCSEYGYDTDSRKAEKTYKIIKKQAAQLKRFMGNYAAYQQLLWDIERL